MNQNNYHAQQSTHFNMGYTMRLMNNNYAVIPPFYAEQQSMGMARPWDIVTPRLTEQNSDRGNDSSQSKPSKKNKKRAEWTTEQSGFLLQVWADNYDYINSAHSRKAWKKVLEKVNTRFPNELRSMDQI